VSRDPAPLSESELPAIDVLLAAATPLAWLELATLRPAELLLDHADCEKKAASTAIALMFSYPGDHPLAMRLSRLAREELRHFEMVARLMRRLGMPQRRLQPGRYAAALRRAVRSAEPARKLGLLLVSALIEARSCERFACLAPRLDGEVSALYASLQDSEARHYGIYLQFAAAADPANWRRRAFELALIEAELVTRPDQQFRFHSGPPAGST